MRGPVVKPLYHSCRQLLRCDREEVFRPDNDIDSPEHTIPAEAGRSHAGRTKRGWITDCHAQPPKVRADQVSSLSSEP